MKILILGGQGMLGTALKNVFNDLNPYILGREALDITNRDAVFRFLEHTKPEVVINAAAYTNVEGAEDNQEEALRVNGEAVGFIAEAAKELDATLMHYSTDYVFDGTKKEGYNEDDSPAAEPLNVYGASKLLGETELVKNTEKFYLIRTSWLFGARGKNFVDTMLRLARERDELRIVNDQHGKPTYTVDLAQATRRFLEGMPAKGSAEVGDYPYGIYHLTNEGGATTWFDFAQEIFKQASLSPKVMPVSSAEFPTKARRPAYSILNNTKFPPLRPWREALADYLAKSS